MDLLSDINDPLEALAVIEVLRVELCAAEAEMLEERFRRPALLGDDERDLCERARRGANRSLLQLAESAPKLVARGWTISLISVLQGARRRVIYAADQLLAREELT